MTTQPTRLEVRANMEIEMECPTCGTLCVSSGEDDWTPVELLSASKPAAPEGWKLAMVERSYDMRAKAIIAFNTAEQSGKDRDDALDAAWQAMLAASPAAPAQSAEPVAWFIADDNGNVYRATGYEHERDQWRAVGHEVYPLFAAPQPSPTAVVLDERADAWRDAFNERHEFDVYPEHFMSGLCNEFAAGWHAALKSKARAASPQPVAQPVEQTRALVCLICNSTGESTPCAYPTEINRQQAKRIAELVADVAENDALIDSLRAQIAARPASGETE